MKKQLLKLWIVLLVAFAPLTKTNAGAYAVWCEENATLYFFKSSETLKIGDMHNGHVITEVWHGTSVTESFKSGLGGTKDVYSDSPLKTVVFEETFKKVEPLTCSGWFSDCGSLTEVQGLSEGYLNTSKVTSMHWMFAHCRKLKSLDLSKFDTSNVTSMQAMFYDCASLTTLDVSHFDTSNVKDMWFMFKNCYSITSLDVSHFITSNVTEMDGMFEDCSKLSSLDLSNFDTSKVTTMKSMFFGCGVTSLDLSNFDTSHVGSMYRMFKDCKNLKSLNISSFNTSRVSDMMYMFEGCTSLISLDLSSFDTNNVTYMNKMFYDCNNLESIFVGDDWEVYKVKESKKMFVGCNSIVGQDGTTYDANAANDKTKAHYAAGGYLRYKDSSSIRIVNKGITSKGDWYSLEGRRLNGEPKAKGVYIVNGKRVVNK